jgi:hypothetical protein
MPGTLYKPGAEIKTEGVQPEKIQRWLDRGRVRWGGEDPIARFDRPTEARVGEDANGNDHEATLLPSDRELEVEERLAEIEAEQAEAGVEPAPEAEPHRVEVDLGEGTVTETGGEDEFEDDDDADSQVS